MYCLVVAVSSGSPHQQSGAHALADEVMAFWIPYVQGQNVDIFHAYSGVMHGQTLFVFQRVLSLSGWNFPHS
jgi:hypothetical protein